MKNFEQFGMEIPEILLPKNKNLMKWSVVACDQYTQDEEYWKKASEIAGSSPSTLNLILPEVYLGRDDTEDRIKKIQKTMKSYLEEGIFDSPQKEFIYLERKTAYGRTRKGLIAAIDLDSYEWKPFSKAKIRATEATIVARIPPRKAIRKNAPLELPHIMLLVNDPEKKLVEGTGALVKNQKPLYDGDLMENSGHISGWTVKDDETLNQVYESLLKIKEKNTDSEGNAFMFAVGDGNHSLATAKAVWEEYREEQKKAGVPEEKIALSAVRYALVEIVNIYDSGLTFEPIHRVIFGADSEKLICAMAEKLCGKIVDFTSEEELENEVKNSKSDFGFVYTKGGKTIFKGIKTEIQELAVSRLQPELDSFIADENKNGAKIEIDYIHGSEEVFRLGKKDGALSIMLPPVAKDSFFDTISKSGPLPRKSFSMGEASEKRFYLECRKLF